MQQRLSPEGFALLKSLEGFRPDPLPLADGRWVVGYGHVVIARPDEAVTDAAAEQMLADDVARVEHCVRNAVLAPLSQPQFDALVSFAFAVGEEAFVRSDVVRRLNAGDTIAAACAMDAFRKASFNGGEPQVFDALVRRRAIEKSLFLSLAVPVAAPSAAFRAQLDHAAAILGAPSAAAPLPELASVQRSNDETAERLKSILARDANTARTLLPPPPEDEPTETLELSVPARPVRKPEDTRGLAIVSLVGAALLIAGIVAFAQGDQTLSLLLSAPGFLVALMGVWSLVRDSIAPEKRFTA